MFRRVIIQQVRILGAGRSLSICVWDDRNLEIKFLSFKLSCVDGWRSLLVLYFLQVYIVLHSESQRVVASVGISRVKLALEDVGYQCETEVALGTVSWYLFSLHMTSFL